MAYDPERERKARLIALRRLEEARAIKCRLEAGTAFAWEAVRLANLVREARVYAREARAHRLPRAVLRPVASGLSYKVVNTHGNKHE